MSRKRRRTTKKFREKYPRKVGDFIKVFDSNGGHPARIYYADPINDVYYIQRFSTHGRKDRVKLSHNINTLSVAEQWLIKKPVAVRYDDIILEPRYINFVIHPDDQKILEKYQKHNLEIKK